MEESVRADAAGPSRVPSRPEREPWNTVGLPKSTSAVRRAVREIESRLQEDRRTEPLEEANRGRDQEAPTSTQVARTRLMWQAREKGKEPPRSSVEYRTDFFPDKEPRGENILILKIEEVPTVEKKDVTVQTTNVETIETYQIQSYFNYERSWQDFRNCIWSSKGSRLGTINSDRVSSVESHIPRVRTERVCGKCRKPVVGDRKYCEVHETNENYHKFLPMDPQRSRTNFFGNSNSYALRCNLFAVAQNPHLNTQRRKFYMTPDPDKSDTFTKFEKGYETFQAKKRVFYRQKLNRPHDGVHLTDMW